MNNLINALWSRDLSTLWHGIGRTIDPMIFKEKRKVIINLFAIVFMITLPFVILLSYTIIVFFYSTKITNISDYYYCGILILNLMIFFMAIIGIKLKSAETYKISPLYMLLLPLGSHFLVVAYLANIIPLLLLTIGKNSSKKTIEWKGRIYTYKKIGGSMI